MRLSTLLLCALILLPLALFSQAPYARATIHLNGHLPGELAAAGIDITHGIWDGQGKFTSEFSQEELRRLRQAGFSADILIADVQAHYLEQNARLAQELELRSDGDSCDAVVARQYPYAIPEHFVLGSMGGFYTYEEMLDQLDAMAAEYPHLISARQPIGDVLTHEGRPIYWMRLSDNPDVDEDEPELLYTALHHAREPNSLSQLIFFMWYVLENYDKDAEVRALVDHTELYLVPCINPDGYIHNQTTDPDGGGFWRKNRRDNGNGTFGVDLNRNYGFEWAAGSGSSFNSGSQTYHGPEPFSEPETRAIRQLCLEHDFRIALNYHTFSNVLIYPWTHTGEYTPDQEAFGPLAQEMSYQNFYGIGTITETLGYLANGSSDDWMYGEQTEKNRILAMTPEVGASFWPTIDRIEINCLATMHMNLTGLRAVHNYALLDYPKVRYVTSRVQALDYTLRRIGLADGPFTVNLAPLSSNVASTGDPRAYQLELWESRAGSFPVVLSDDIADGEEVVLLLELDNGTWIRRDTLRWIYFDGQSGYLDEISSAGEWQQEETGWGLTTEQYFSPPSSFTDSPDGDYELVSENYLTLNKRIYIPDPEKAILSFKAQWSLSREQPDFAQVLLSVNGGDFFPLCGKYTQRLYYTDVDWTPAYMNRIWPWVEEEVSLAPYVEAGDSISIQFLMISAGGTADGFYFDDLIVDLGESAISGPLTLRPGDFNTLSIYPNPAREQVTVELFVPDPPAGAPRLEVYNGLGQRVEVRLFPAADRGKSRLLLDTRGWAPGLYWLRPGGGGGAFGAQKLLVTK
ncbi:MAG: hypothetical protein J5I94_05020 [Phaeodactylibacter sp.]|nr:hypothetical protein [Phaeodactylibacter sp.]